MSSFRIRWGDLVVVAAVCLIAMSDFAISSTDAQEGMVMISDSYNRRAPAQRQVRRMDKQVRRAACNSGYCDLGCDTGCCGEGCCDSGCCGDCCCCSPWWAHCSGVAGEFLYLHTTDADVAYAQQQNGIGGAGTVPFGRIGSLGPHHEPGFRAAVTKAFSDCSSLIVTYSFFESDSIDGIQPPTIPGGGGAVGSLVHHPGAAITASVGPVNAAYDVDFQLGDVVYRSLWKATETYAINWSVGGRYGSLTQDFRSLGVSRVGKLAPSKRGRTSIFDGGGLMLGLDGERRLGSSGFSIYSKGAISTLSGRFHADYLLNNNSTGAPPNGVLLALADWEGRSDHLRARPGSRSELDWSLP